MIKKIKTVSKGLNILALFSMSFVFIYKFFLINVPERIQYSSILGEIFYNLALASLASYIFYFIVVHLQEYEDKKIIYSVIINKLNKIVKNKNTVLTKLFKLSGNPKKTPIKIEYLTGSLEKVKVDEISELMFGEPYFDYKLFNYMQFYANQTLSKIKEIFLLPNLEANLVNKISNLESLDYFSFIMTFNGFEEYKPKDLGPLSKYIFEYNKIVDELSDYIKQVKRNY